MAEALSTRQWRDSHRMRMPCLPTAVRAAQALHAGLATAGPRQLVPQPSLGSNAVGVEVGSAVGKELGLAQSVALGRQPPKGVSCAHHKGPRGAW